MSSVDLERETTIGNWRTSPYSRWAFRNVEKPIPTATIKTAAGEPDPVVGQSRSLGGFDLALPGGRRMDLQSFEAATSTDAIVALVGGELVYESYRNGMTAHSSHILMSASKSITGLIAGIQHHNGAIDVARPVIDYVPEVEGTAYADATLRQLLDMRTGIALDGTQARLYGNASNWESLQPGEEEIDFLDFVKLLRAPVTHGGPFKYVSVNTDLLCVALERSSGRSFAQIMSEVLWQPLGAEHDAFVTLMRGGSARCTGGLCMTARDLARVGRMVLAQGRARRRQIVSADWVADTLQDGDSAAWIAGEFGKSFAAFGPMSYRSGWYVMERAPRTMFAMGIHGQNLFVDPDRDFVLVKFSSQPTPIEQVGLTHMGVAEIRRCLIGR